MNLLHLLFAGAWKDRGFLLRNLCIPLRKKYSVQHRQRGKETVILLVLKSADMNMYPFPSLVHAHLKFD